MKVKEDGSYLARGGAEAEEAGGSCGSWWEGAKVEKVGAVRLAMRQMAIGETRQGNRYHDYLERRHSDSAKRWHGWRRSNGGM